MAITPTSLPRASAARTAAPLRIGPHAIGTPVVLAPMAGVTDKPFRLLCKRMGAGLAVSEMTISDPRFWNTAKSRHRMDHAGEPEPISVQIAGTEPRQLAEAARHLAQAELSALLFQELCGRFQQGFAELPVVIVASRRDQS